MSPRKKTDKRKESRAAAREIATSGGPPTAGSANPYQSPETRTAKPRQPMYERHRADAPLGGESRASIAVTVAWMTFFLTTVATTLLGVANWAIAAGSTFQPNQPTPLQVLPGLFLGTATLTGLGVLGLIPLVYRTRKIPPPRSITIAAIVAGTLPLAIFTTFLLVK